MAIAAKTIIANNKKNSLFASPIEFIVTVTFFSGLAKATRKVSQRSKAKPKHSMKAKILSFFCMV